MLVLCLLARTALCCREHSGFNKTHSSQNGDRAAFTDATTQTTMSERDGTVGRTHRGCPASVLSLLPRHRA